MLNLLLSPSPTKTGCSIPDDPRPHILHLLSQYPVPVPGRPALFGILRIVSLSNTVLPSLYRSSLLAPLTIKRAMFSDRRFRCCCSTQLLPSCIIADILQPNFMYSSGRTFTFSSSPALLIVKMALPISNLDPLPHPFVDGVAPGCSLRIPAPWMPLKSRFRCPPEIGDSLLGAEANFLFSIASPKHLTESNKFLSYTQLQLLSLKQKNENGECKSVRK